MMYAVWRVFEDSGTRFYIVNMQTKKVQSTWSNLPEARAVCEKLNVLEVKRAK